MNKLTFAFCLLALINWYQPQAMGQAGVSSGSYGVARAGFSRVDNFGNYRMPEPSFFRVEEFVNYHRHNLPLPSKGKKVHLDVQDLKLENGKVVYQFGITAPRALTDQKLPPLNLVLVIDESGSMGGEKIANLKSALHTIIERFRPNDRISIVGFEGTARVICKAQPKTNIGEISRAIDDIHAGGSTNLHAGLMCGYEMALEHFDPERTNRMIFLTDGNANVGVTESEEIAKASKRCKKKGISLVTIGLGVDMNNGLLRELADSGRGVMHYVGDAKDIQKTFVDEFDSILAPAARKVRLKINFTGTKKAPKLFGYEKDCEIETTNQGHRISLRLDDLNCGATQVVMAQLSSVADRQVSATASLAYTDAVSNKKVTTKGSSQELDEDSDLQRSSIKRNYAIALVAKSMHSAAYASNDQRNEKAAKLIQKGIKKANLIVNQRDDKNLKRVIKIAEDYRENLQ